MEQNGFEDAGLEDWNDVATSQGMPATIRSGRGKEKGSPIEPPEEPTP